MVRAGTKAQILPNSYKLPASRPNRSELPKPGRFPPFGGAEAGLAGVILGDVDRNAFTSLQGAF